MIIIYIRHKWSTQGIDKRGWLARSDLTRYKIAKTQWNVENCNRNGHKYRDAPNIMTKALYLR